MDFDRFTPQRTPTKIRTWIKCVLMFQVVLLVTLSFYVTFDRHVYLSNNMYFTAQRDSYETDDTVNKTVGSSKASKQTALVVNCQNCSVACDINVSEGKPCLDSSIPGVPINREIIKCVLAYCAQIGSRTLRHPIQSGDINICPCISPLSEGRNGFSMKPMPFNITTPVSLEPLVPDMYTPEGCSARQHVAIIIPYRNRERHLMALLPRLIQVLKRQQAAFRIFVVEQRFPVLFNKAALMNVGYKLSSELTDFDCFIFHDVDFLPEDDRHRYSCSSIGPVHLGAFHDRHKYKLQYRNIFGGVTAFTRDQYTTINGFSNRYYGWGGEDDDMSLRIREKKYEIQRDCRHVAGYTVITHDRDENNKVVNRRATLYRLFKDRQTNTDGINNMDGIYHVITQKTYALYTHILTDIKEQS